MREGGGRPAVLRVGGRGFSLYRLDPHFFRMNAGVGSGGSTLRARSVGLIASFTPGGSRRVAVRNRNPAGVCDSSMRGFSPSGMSEWTTRSVGSEDRIVALGAFVAT